jgi:YHS domain-containing protein
MLACRTLSARDMHPTNSQRIRANWEARCLRSISAALTAGAWSFALASSISAGEPIGQGIAQVSSPVVTPQPSCDGDSTLLAQAETAPTGKKEKKAPKLNVDQKGVMLKGYDPVAYFKQGKPVKGEAKYSSVYEGATYYFASSADKSEFEKSPAKYKPQYGGYCANAMTKGKLNDIDPNYFFVYRGKLYVCTGAPQMKNFKSKPDINIKKADKKWELYQPPEIPGFLGDDLEFRPSPVIT